MELIDYLSEYGLERLSAEFFIKTSRHSIYENLILLKYSQLNSPMNEKIVQQCRGIILDAAQNWSIISYPFDKFFNYGEANAASIDWEEAKVYDKLDGSLMVLYFNPYSSNWEVSTSGTPDASGSVNSLENLTFNKLFWQTWNSLQYQLPEMNDAFDNSLQYRCFMFELMTPYNSVVVRHSKSSLVLHGVRNLSNLKEEAPEIFASLYGWECVRRFDLSSWDDVITACKNLNPSESEGYIVCDSNFNRVKVKSPQYVALAHAKGKLSPRRLLEIIVNSEGDEFLSYFPEWTPLYQLIVAKYEALIEEILLSYEAIASTDNQKEFASLALQQPYSGILFGLRSGKITSVREGFKSLPIAKLETMIKLDSM